MATTILLRLANIAITAVVARILDPHDFGVFAVATTAYTIVAAFSELGITSCMSRTDLDVAACAPTLLSASIVSNLTIAGLMVMFARPIATALGSPDGASPVRVMGIIVVLGGISAVPTGQCNRDFKLNRLFLANLLSFIPSTIVLIVMAKTGSGAMAFAWSRVAGQATSYLVVLIATPERYWPGLTRYALSVLYKFGVPLACANFVGFILQNVDYVFIGHFLGATELGSYVLAFNVAGWSWTLLIGVLSSVAMPAFTKVKHDRAKLMEAITYGVRAVVLIAAPMCALAMALARPLVLTVYGSHWAAAGVPLSILSLYGLAFVVSQLFVSMLTALGRPRFVLLVQVIWLAVLIPAMAIGVHRGATAGAAVAHIVVIVPLVLPCYFIVLRRATGVAVGDVARAAFPPLVAAAIAALLAWAVAARLGQPAVQLTAGAGVGSLCYCVLMAPPLIALLTRGREPNAQFAAILRVYFRTARTLGLPLGPQPGHARRRPRRHAHARY